MPIILPLVYNDALSYYENVLILIEWCNKLNEQIKASFAELDKKIAQAEQNANKYTDNKLQEFRQEFAELELDLQTRIDELIAKTKAELDKQLELMNQFRREIEKEISDLVATIDQTVEELRQDITNKFSDFETRFNDLVNRVNAELREFNDDLVNLSLRFNEYQIYNDAWLKQRMVEFKSYIDERTSRRNGNNVLVDNPTNLLHESLKKTLEDIYYSFARFGGLTADEYASLQLTADEYASYNITALDYRIKARFIFFDRIYLSGIRQEFEQLKSDNTKWQIEQERKLSMLSPFTGTRETWQEIILHLVAFHKNALTAQEYQALSLSANDYIAHNLTAYEYDFRGKELLTRAFQKNSNVREVHHIVSDLEKIGGGSE